MKGKKEKSKHFLAKLFLVCIILFIMAWIGIEEYKEKSKEQEKAKRYDTELLIQKQITTEEGIMKNYPKEEVIEEYKGYSVIAKLEIPSIQLETYVLKKYSVKALNVSVVKFWGANPNEIGNFCIAGHNFQNKNMFHDLRKVEIGDRLFIIDNQTGKVEYEIYNWYTVPPEDITCLFQETNGRREVTLITCTNDSKKRIIVKAKEVE